MSRYRTTTAALLLVSVLALTGCSESGGDDRKSDDPKKAVAAVAKEWQEADHRGDYRRLCELSTAREKHGTMDQCIVFHGGATPQSSSSAASSPSAPSAPSAASGSLAPSGPDGASTGPVTVEGDPVEVPAVGKHPAGWGVMVTFTVSKTIDRYALRVVDEGGTWKVDQYTEVQGHEMSQGNPVLAALTGEN
ncbi:hypothetical protein [Streptomyces subrutilus]|uniref:hypothetical protein n=1 Tax=Streptomyces subrutilus TaxID=36818 RepID=UPI0033FD0BBD